MAARELTHLDLFSGIGGFALAAKWAGFRTIGFCEIDKYCQKVLAKNFLDDSDAGLREQSNEEIQAGGSVANAATLFGDIRDLDGRQFRGVTLITGGFPCQPFSCAGKRRGKEDDRHLWPEMLRVISEARPAWVLGENVAGIINMELDSVLSDLESIGYATRPFAVPACSVDAKHRRMRVWIVAYAEHAETARQRRNSWEVLRKPEPIRSNGSGSLLADTKSQQGAARNNRRESRQTSIEEQGEFRGSHSGELRPRIWLPEPGVGRVAHGVPARVDRLKGLGNAIVPQVAYQILKAIADIETQTDPRLSASIS